MSRGVPWRRIVLPSSRVLRWSRLSLLLLPQVHDRSDRHSTRVVSSVFLGHPCVDVVRTRVHGWRSRGDTGTGSVSNYVSCLPGDLGLGDR